MNQKVFEIISGVAKKSATELEQLSDQQGLWDSLLHVELVVALESEFDIFFEPDEIAEIDTPIKVLELVKSKVSSQ